MVQFSSCIEYVWSYSYLKYSGTSLRTSRLMVDWQFIIKCALQRLNQIVNELEEMKPLVLKKIENNNIACQDAALPSQNSDHYSMPVRPACLRNQLNSNVNTPKVLQPHQNPFHFVSLLFESNLMRLFCTSHSAVVCCWILPSLPSLVARGFRKVFVQKRAFLRRSTYLL